MGRWWTMYVFIITFYRLLHDISYILLWNDQRLQTEGYNFFYKKVSHPLGDM
jgi:hypothetical protein